jgi:hypothetical protein
MRLHELEIERSGRLCGAWPGAVCEWLREQRGYERQPGECRRQAGCVDSGCLCLGWGIGSGRVGACGWVIRRGSVRVSGWCASLLGRGSNGRVRIVGCEHCVHSGSGGVLGSGGERGRGER